MVDLKAFSSQALGNDAPECGQIHQRWCFVGVSDGVHLSPRPTPLHSSSSLSQAAFFSCMNVILPWFHCLRNVICRAPGKGVFECLIFILCVYTSTERDMWGHVLLCLTSKSSLCLSSDHDKHRCGRHRHEYSVSFIYCMPHPLFLSRILFTLS